MVCPMTTGATSAATELTTIATRAVITFRFSLAMSGANLLIPARSVPLDWRTLLVSSVYFIMAGASLRVIELDVFRRRRHQVLVRSGGQHLALHQENDLIVVCNRGDLLGH